MAIKGEIPDREPKTMEEWAEFVKQDFIGREEPLATFGDHASLIQTAEGVTARDFRDYSLAIGNDNPLYTDSCYAANTRWAGIIAPPTFNMILRAAGTAGVVYKKGIKVTSLNGGIECYNYDVIRPGDRLRNEKIESDIEMKTGGRGGVMPIVYARQHCWNQRDQLIVKMVGWSLHPQLHMDGGARISTPRGIYKYSDQERERIINDIVNYPPRRGCRPLYWEDVNVGDKLPTKCTGPCTYGDFRANCDGVRLAQYGKSFEISYYLYKGRNSGKSSNPATNWDWADEHSDPIVCVNRGIPLPFDHGVARSAYAATIVTDWMGDDGWLFRLKTAHRETYLIGDTLWLTGTVVGKEMIKEGASVRLELSMSNQLGRVATQGEATVLLPTRVHGSVKLPIPISLIPHETLS